MVVADYKEISKNLPGRAGEIHVKTSDTIADRWAETLSRVSFQTVCPSPN
jgi:hypothetical protein